MPAGPTCAAAAGMDGWWITNGWMCMVLVSDHLISAFIDVAPEEMALVLLMK
jgi:hypothetical protein